MGANNEQHQLAKEETAALAAEGLLLLPPQLQRLEISRCRELSIVTTPLDGGKDGGGGLQGLRSLLRLSLLGCPKLLSSYSSTSFSTCFPFPNSLEYLNLRTRSMKGMPMLMPVSNLISLTRLSIFDCGDLVCKGLLSLLLQGHLRELYVKETPSFFGVFNQELPFGPFKLQVLKVLSVDDVAGLTSTPTCSLLFSSLATLEIYWVDRFTEEQESILFVSSLNEINFMHCSSLQYLPARLHTLPNLKKLRIEGCKAIKMLPADSFPSSLQELVIDLCPEIRSLPKDCLPSSLQRLLIRKCPGIRSLPTLDDLPTSLRELDVHGSESEELRRQCHKFKEIIPIVKA